MNRVVREPDRIVLVEWEDAVRVSKETCVPTAATIDAHRCHRVTLGWVAYADEAVLACVIDEDCYPGSQENEWDIYPRGIVKRITQVQTGNRLEWADVMDLANR